MKDRAYDKFITKLNIWQNFVRHVWYKIFLALHTNMNTKNKKLNSG